MDKHRRKQVVKFQKNHPVQNISQSIQFVCKLIHQSDVFNREPRKCSILGMFFDGPDSHRVLYTILLGCAYGNIRQLWKFWGYQSFASSSAKRLSNGYRNKTRTLYTNLWDISSDVNLLLWCTTTTTLSDRHWRVLEESLIYSVKK